MESGTNREGEWELFVQMARSFPVRTLIFTFSLPLFGLLQLINGYLTQAHLGILLLLTLVSVAFSVALTRYQLAVYRRRRVTGQLHQSS